MNAAGHPEAEAYQGVDQGIVQGGEPVALGTAGAQGHTIAGNGKDHGMGVGGPPRQRPAHGQAAAMEVAREAAADSGSDGGQLLHREPHEPHAPHAAHLSPKRRNRKSLSEQRLRQEEN